ncbi:MAG: DUF4265 domain-containing protein [Sediminibacterium sp.]|jgi:hypothetical protein|nr:DUF4265 domain-containing protein [Chitinophagaceae bacterium]MCA6446592.1 DUF4265 domain-containing protein [Chitinophagaceae bacterium]
MTEKNDNLVKIAFSFHSNVLDRWTVETMWASPVDIQKGLYKLENIPFYAPVASEDIVFAEYDNTEERLVYRETVEYSGNSTVQVIVMEKSIDANSIRNNLELLGCPSEKCNDSYFVVEIPASVDYRPVKEKLKELQDNGIIDYAEPSLSAHHSA